MMWLAHYYIGPEGIDTKSVGDVVLIELCNIMADYIHSILQKLSDDYLEDMPDEDQVQLIRFHMGKNAKFDDNKNWENEYLESNWDKYPFLIGTIFGEDELTKRYNDDAKAGSNRISCLFLQTCFLPFLYQWMTYKKP